MMGVGYGIIFLSNNVGKALAAQNPGAGYGPMLIPLSAAWLLGALIAFSGLIVLIVGSRKKK